MTDRLFQLIADAPFQQQMPWWEWRIPTNVVVTSPLKPAMLGYDPDEFAGAGYEAYTALLHPDDYDRTMNAMWAHLEGLARLYEVDYRIRRKDGEYTWYMDRGAVIERDDRGAPLRLRGIVIDLGEELSDQLQFAAIVTAVRTALPERGAERPIVVCAQCGRLRTDKAAWARVHEDLVAGFPGQVSHSLCSECIDVLYPAVAEAVKRRLALD